MRIAILSDIHGNLPALEAVLDDIARQGADRIVNLGDCLSGPLWAADTADRLMALDALTIRGNHERQLLDRPPEAMGPSDRAADAQLAPRHREWLRSLPAGATLGDDVLLCHGTPSDDLVYLLEDVQPHRFGLAAAALAAVRLGPVAQGLVLCGHSHLPRVVRLPGGPVIVNPGSVGLPAYADDAPHPHVVETGSPHARYALAETTAAGWRIELRAIDYGWDEAARVAAAAGRPDWAQALATGFAPVAAS